MGSFANSILVACDDVTAVADTVRTTLLQDGWSNSEFEPDARDPMVTTPYRTVQVVGQATDWVGILDSDLVESSNLAAALSASLNCPVFQFMVNDSDTWHYQLFHQGTQVDQFHGGPAVESYSQFSANAASDEEAEDGYITGQFGQTLEDFQQQTQQLMENAPGDIRQIQQRMLEGENVSSQEAQDYANWISEQLQPMVQQLEKMCEGKAPGSMAGSLDSPPANGLQTVDKHLKNLRPLIPQSVNDQQILQSLTASRVFAEECLADFLKLLRIEPTFAHLSFSYLDEFDDQWLNGHGLRREARLRFERS